MTYRPTFRRQLGDPTTTYDAYECTFSSGAMALDFHTLGRIKIWGGTLLSRARLTAADIKDGTNLQQVARAWSYYGQYLSIRSGGNWTDVMACLRQGRGVILQIDEDQLNYAERGGSPFMGSHGVYINPELFSTATRAILGNPLATAWVLAYLTHLRAGAEKLSEQTHAGYKNDRPRLYFAVTAPHLTAAPVVAYRYGGQPTGRGSFKVRAAGANLRKSPYVRSDNVIKLLPAGTTFACRQTTSKGTLVKGSSKWLGTADGLHWVHASTVAYAGPITGRESIR